MGVALSAGEETCFLPLVCSGPDGERTLASFSKMLRARLLGDGCAPQQGRARASFPPRPSSIQIPREDCPPIWPLDDRRLPDSQPIRVLAIGSIGDSRGLRAANTPRRWRVAPTRTQPEPLPTPSRPRKPLQPNVPHAILPTSWNP